MENPIILVYYIFENFCLVLLGGVLFNYFSRQNVKPLIKVAIVSGLFLYLLRNILILNDLPVIYHIPITLTFFIAILNKLGKIEWLLSILTGFLGYIVSTFNDLTMLGYYIKWFNINVENIVNNIYLHLGFGILADMTFIVIIATIVILKYITSFRKEKIDDIC